MASPELDSADRNWRRNLYECRRSSNYTRHGEMWLIAIGYWKTFREVGLDWLWSPKALTEGTYGWWLTRNVRVNWFGYQRGIGLARNLHTALWVRLPFAILDVRHIDLAHLQPLLASRMNRSLSDAIGGYLRCSHIVDTTQFGISNFNVIRCWCSPLLKI